MFFFFLISLSCFFVTNSQTIKKSTDARMHQSMIAKGGHGQVWRLVDGDGNQAAMKTTHVEDPDTRREYEAVCNGL